MRYHVRAMEGMGRLCWLAAPEDVPQADLPVLYMVTEDDFASQWEGMLERIEPALAQGGCEPFVLAAFASDDWNEDFSPWPAPALFKKAADFAGGAQKSLAWLRDTLMPEVEKGVIAQAGGMRRYLMGYSLGGLFALWAAYETRTFAGCASCSGSLWYDGWLDFAKAHTLPAGSRVYLSLGDREGKARNPRMAAVEPVTLEMARLLETDANVADTVFRWQAGGHFDDVPGRMADAVLWLMKRQ